MGWRRGYLSEFLQTEAGRDLIALAILAVFLWVMFKCARIAWRLLNVGEPEENLPNWARVAEQTEHMSFRWSYEQSAKGRRQARKDRAESQQAAEPNAVPDYSADLRRHLSVLGLVPPADMKTVKARYRELVHQYHPDVLGDSGDPGRMAEINIAYDWLESQVRD